MKSNIFSKMVESSADYYLVKNPTDFNIPFIIESEIKINTQTTISKFISKVEKEFVGYPKEIKLKNPTDNTIKPFTITSIQTLPVSNALLSINAKNLTATFCGKIIITGYYKSKKPQNTTLTVLFETLEFSLIQSKRGRKNLGHYYSPKNKIKFKYELINS